MYTHFKMCVYEFVTAQAITYLEIYSQGLQMVSHTTDLYHCYHSVGRLYRLHQLSIQRGKRVRTKHQSHNMAMSLVTRVHDTPRVL